MALLPLEQTGMLGLVGRGLGILLPPRSSPNGCTNQSLSRILLGCPRSSGLQPL